MQIRVLVVDDQVAFRRAARRTIAFTDGFSVVGEVSSGEESLAAVRELRPDLVLMDLRLPGIDGFEAARRIGQESKQPVLVIVSAHGAEDLTGCEVRLKESGAAGFIPKAEFTSARLVSAWRAAATTRG